ncbi:MAG: hypothetical protein IJV46_05465, partial [Acidaminococcaceae bacterium]|nr:hypothetical protein [Acidaminococcaceae bacterium]
FFKNLVQVAALGVKIQGAQIADDGQEAGKQAVIAFIRQFVDDFGGGKSLPAAGCGNLPPAHARR